MANITLLGEALPARHTPRDEALYSTSIPLYSDFPVGNLWLLAPLFMAPIQPRIRHLRGAGPSETRTAHQPGCERSEWCPDQRASVQEISREGTAVSVFVLLLLKTFTGLCILGTGTDQWKFPRPPSPHLQGYRSCRWVDLGSDILSMPPDNPRCQCSYQRIRPALTAATSSIKASRGAVTPADWDTFERRPSHDEPASPLVSEGNSRNESRFIREIHRQQPTLQLWESAQPQNAAIPRGRAEQTLYTRTAAGHHTRACSVTAQHLHDALPAVVGRAAVPANLRSSRPINRLRAAILRTQSPRRRHRITDQPRDGQHQGRRVRHRRERYPLHLEDLHPHLSNNRTLHRHATGPLDRCPFLRRPAPDRRCPDRPQRAADRLAGARQSLWWVRGRIAHRRTASPGGESDSWHGGCVDFCIHNLCMSTEKQSIGCFSLVRNLLPLHPKRAF